MGLVLKNSFSYASNRSRKSPPKEIGGLAVTGFEDLRDERGRLGSIKGATDFAARNFLIFRLGDNAKVVLRPSGTEPKAKAYLEVCSAPCSSGTTAEAWAKTCKACDEQVQKLATDFLNLALGNVGITPQLGSDKVSR